MSKNVTYESILSSFPDSLKNDATTVSLAELTAEYLEHRFKEIDNLYIYAAIDSLPEGILDILAYDFKVDWWDYGYSLEEKRRTLKNSFIVHKRLGTKSAVETAISAIYPDTTVQEWWEYGGKPYWFRLIIHVNDAVIDSAKHDRVLQLIDFYKSLRSRLDGITYAINPAKIPHYIGIAFRTSVKQTIITDAWPAEAMEALADENNTILTDENDFALIISNHSILSEEE